jgi:dephospho-CoA kinase
VRGREGANPFLIGLTGPIGCGKSTVARQLARLGATLIDADVLARDVTAPGSAALEAIRERFGEGVIDPTGALDRAALARIVFEDEAALRDLEAIVHPRVRLRVEAALARAAGEGAAFVVVEAIKLVEGGLAERCDEVWLIDCPREVQWERLRARGLGDADIERRLAVQGERLTERLSGLLADRPHRVVATGGTEEQTRERVEDALADALAPVFPGLPPLGGLSRGGG